MAKLSLQALFNLAPEQAVKYFQAKGYEITFDWHEMLGNAHDKAFTVAKVTKLDVLQTIRHEVDKIFTEGMTERQFIKELTPRLQGLGWWGQAQYTAGNGEKIEYTKGSLHRLKTIYHTNASVGYANGRYQEQMANIDEQEYLMYATAKDPAVRHSHAIMDGIVKKATDPFWRMFYPPNGWRCRCYVIAMSKAEALHYGVVIDLSPGDYQIIEEPIGIDRRTGEVRYGEMAIYADGKGNEYRTDAGWSHGPASRYEPNLSKYDADLVTAYQQ